MYEQYAAIITGFPLFHGFTLDGARMLLASGEVKEYSSGEVLIKEDDEPTFILLVLTGRVQVFVQRQGRDLVITDTGPPTILCELPVLFAIPRSASGPASADAAPLPSHAAA